MPVRVAETSHRELLPQNNRIGSQNRPALELLNRKRAKRGPSISTSPAAVLLALLFNPWLVIEEGSTARAVLTVAFWVAFLVLLVALFEDRRDADDRNGQST
jgi:hypothetical protein